MYPQPIFQKVKADPSFPVLSEIMRPYNTESAIHCHWHPSIEILHLKKGHITLYIGNKSFKLQAGDLCIINQNEIHYATRDSEEPCVMHYIVLSCDILEFNKDSLNYQKYIEPIHTGRLLFPNILEDHFKPYALDLLDYGLHKENGWELRIQSSLLMFLSKLHEHNGYRSNPAKPAEPIMSREKHILTYFEENFTQNLTVASIAKAFSLSEDYFYKLFRKVAGQTPINYLHQLRIQYAKQLLRTTDHNVSSIGEQVGYDSTSYFIKVFKKLTSTTPLAYRNHH